MFHCMSSLSRNDITTLVSYDHHGSDMSDLHNVTFHSFIHYMALQDLLWDILQYLHFLCKSLNELL